MVVGKPEEFNKLVPLTSGITLVDPERLFILYQLAKHVKTLEGSFAEVGVYKGGTARLIYNTPDSWFMYYHLFDTFEGMPETDPTKDLHRKGDFKDTSLEVVSKLFENEQGEVRFHKGFFPTSADALSERCEYSLVHVDCDIYKSVKDCCEFFYPRMIKGGVIIFDDYGFPTCPGAKKAVDEFVETIREGLIYLPTGQSMIVKL